MEIIIIRLERFLVEKNIQGGTSNSENHCY